MLNSDEMQLYDARIASIRLIDAAAVIPQPQRHQYDLSKVGVGGVLRLEGKTHRVELLAAYTEVDDNWRKRKGATTVTELTLFCLDDGATRYLEWSRDDELEIYLSDRVLSASEVGRITDEDGDSVDISDADELCDEKEDLRFGGVDYSYDDDTDMVFEPKDGRRKSFVSVADFGNEKGDRWLTIEGWCNSAPEDDESWGYEAWLSHTVNSRAIEVICLGDAAQR